MGGWPSILRTSTRRILTVLVNYGQKNWHSVLACCIGGLQDLLGLSVPAESVLRTRPQGARFACHIKLADKLSPEAAGLS